ncbi:MAG: 6-phosphogluconolactonase [Burkholderiales bacterium]|nr:6-phosphogluconolactonase [Burkholderiales bacterium]
MTIFQCQVHQACDAVTLGRDLADFVAGCLRDGLAQRDQALLVVSGGSTPVPFFEALSAMVLDWARVTVTLADERWVPPDHLDSNERLVRQHLLKGPAAQARWVSLKTADATAQQGQPKVESALAALPWPADVVVLGMGSDGHTASLFPHSVALREALTVPAVARCLAVAAPDVPNVPVPRISLNKRALLDARQVVVHITGAAKWALLQEAIKPGAVEDLPIRLALQGHPCHVYQTL